MKLLESPREAIRFLRNLGVAFSIALLALVFPVHSFQIAGKSMQPHLVDGEKILVDQLTLMLTPIHRGDILVFRHPMDPTRYLVKRVVGLPGETVEIRRGSVLVGGSVQIERYLPARFRDSDDHGPVHLKDTEYFVLGDHRRDSEDSRVWGPLPRDLVIGRAFMAYWPPSEAGPLR